MIPRLSNEPPIPYRVGVSDRARRIRLTVSAEEGVVVVVPQGTHARVAERVVRERCGWLRQALRRLEPHASHLEQTRPLPSAIELLATGERFDVVPSPDHPRPLSLRDDAIVLGGVNEPAQRRALLAWLHAAAGERLVPMLRELSLAEDIPFARAQIRGQRTRWASVSRRGTISLNRSLVFLPEELVRYVILHELVHVLRFDHSPAFWAELAARDPACRRKAAAMRHAWRYVPGWAISREG